MLTFMRAALLMLTLLSLCQAEDLVELTNGTKLRGTIIQQDEKRIMLRVGSGAFGLDRAQVKSVTTVVDPVPPASTVAGSSKSANAIEFPGWKTLTSAVRILRWGQDLAQIPATVVSVGIMRNVPYVSYRCSKDYEINIYGDLDAPVCIEVGIYRALVADAAAQQNCIDLLNTVVLKSAPDRVLLSSIKRSGEVTTRGRLTLEVTPPTAEDAYGGWWVAAYDAEAIEAIRTADGDLAAMTMPKTETNISSEDSGHSWSRADMAHARPSAPNTSAKHPTATAQAQNEIKSGGRVWVREYTRKDGTLVPAHSRSR